MASCWLSMTAPYILNVNLFPLSLPTLFVLLSCSFFTIIESAFLSEVSACSATPHLHLYYSTYFSCL